MEPENIGPMIQVIQAAEANIIRVRDQHIQAAKVLLKKSDEKEAALRTLVGRAEAEVKRTNSAMNQVEAARKGLESLFKKELEAKYIHRQCNHGLVAGCNGGLYFRFSHRLSQD